MKGIAASPGIAIGQPLLKLNERVEIEKKEITEDMVEEEIIRLHSALKQAQKDLYNLKDLAVRKIGKKKAGIFQAHILLLEDPELIPAIENTIRQEKVKAESAVNKNIQQYAEIFASMEDEYMSNRGADIRDIGQRIIKHLLGYTGIENDEVEEKGIIVASYLSPASTARLNTDRVLAFVTQEGSATSHTSIMARSLGIPAVVGVGEGLLASISKEDILIVDGNEGEVIINPDRDVLANYQQKLKNHQQKEKKLQPYRNKKAITKDGKTVKIFGNLGNLSEIDLIMENGGEGIGLFRTEFLYMNRGKMPTEEEQFEAYRRVALKMGDRPVIIRTLDIGGDKDLSYLKLPAEMNPFLGYRAIRLCVDRKDIFKPQLKAILRAADYGNIKIMYPMISSLEEIKQANKILSEVKQELQDEGKEYRDQIDVGIMIETPAAVSIADLLAEKVDFFSIGTNDLTQYTLAADRTNEKIADIYNHYHPAVLRMIVEIIKKAHRVGIPVGVCGESAGDELLLPFLLGAGLDEFSMNAVSILRIKKLLSKWTRREAREVVNEVLDVWTGVEVKEILQEYNK